MKQAQKLARQTRYGSWIVQNHLAPSVRRSFETTEPNAVIMEEEIIRGRDAQRKAHRRGSPRGIIRGSARLLGPAWLRHDAR